MSKFSINIIIFYIILKYVSGSEDILELKIDSQTQIQKNDVVSNEDSLKKPNLKGSTKYIASTSLPQVIASQELKPKSILDEETKPILDELKPVPFLDGETKPILDAKTEPLPFESIKPVFDKETKPILDELKPVPLLDGETKPILDAKTEPLPFETIKPVFDEETKPIFDAKTEPLPFETIKPVFDEETKPILDKLKPVPLLDGETKPILDAKTEPLSFEPTKPIFDEKPKPIEESDNIGPFVYLYPDYPSGLSDTHPNAAQNSKGYKISTALTSLPDLIELQNSELERNLDKKTKPILDESKFNGPLVHLHQPYPSPLYGAYPNAEHYTAVREFPSKKVVAYIPSPMHTDQTNMNSPHLVETDVPLIKNQGFFWPFTQANTALPNDVDEKIVTRNKSTNNNAKSEPLKDANFINDNIQNDKSSADTSSVAALKSTIPKNQHSSGNFFITFGTNWDIKTIIQNLLPKSKVL